MQIAMFPAVCIMSHPRKDHVQSNKHPIPNVPYQSKMPPICPIQHAVNRSKYIKQVWNSSIFFDHNDTLSSRPCHRRSNKHPLLPGNDHLGFWTTSSTHKSHRSATVRIDRSWWRPATIFRLVIFLVVCARPGPTDTEDAEKSYQKNAEEDTNDDGTDNTRR